MSNVVSYRVSTIHDLCLAVCYIRLSLPIRVFERPLFDDVFCMHTVLVCVSVRLPKVLFSFSHLGPLLVFDRLGGVVHPTPTPTPSGFTSNSLLHACAPVCSLSLSPPRPRLEPPPFFFHCFLFYFFIYFFVLFGLFGLSIVQVAMPALYSDERLRAVARLMLNAVLFRYPRACVSAALTTLSAHASSTGTCVFGLSPGSLRSHLRPCCSSWLLGGRWRRRWSGVHVSDLYVFFAISTFGKCLTPVLLTRRGVFRSWTLLSSPLLSR